MRDVRPGQSFDQRSQDGVAGGARDLLVERQVCVDEPLVVERLLQPRTRGLVERGAQAYERVVVDVQRGQAGRLGLEEATHRVVGRRVVLQLGDEGDRSQQQRRVEGGHEGAVAVPGLEDAERAQRVHALAQDAAGDAEGRREVLLGGQALTGLEPSVQDHLLDPVDDVVGT